MNMTPKYVREANLRQQALCAKEVARIRRSGEQYQNGRLINDRQQRTRDALAALRRRVAGADR